MDKDHHIRKKEFSNDTNEEDKQKDNEMGVGVGEKLEEGYVAEISPRIIEFGKQKEKKPELNLIGDKAAYTSTYIRLTNGILAYRIERIKKLKEMDKKFDESIKLLQSGPSEDSSLLSEIVVNLDNEQEIKEVLQCLIIQKGIAESELEYLENSITKKRQEVEIQETEINKKRQEIQKCSAQFTELSKKHSSGKSLNIDDKSIKPKSDAIQKIKEELEILGKNQDVKKLSQNIDELILSLNLQK